MKKSGIAVAALLIMVSVARADHTAVYFEQGSDRTKPLFTSESKSVTEAGIEHVTSTYRDSEGHVLYEEKVELVGNNVKKVSIDQAQTGDKALVEIKDGRAYFSKTSDGKSKSGDEKIGDSFVMSANFQKYVTSHWKEISDGETLEFRFGVWDRIETVGFKVFKMGDTKVAGQDAVLVKLKPSSFLIAALVNPLVFKFAADGSKILELNGRVPVKKKLGSSFKDQDAEGVFTYAL